MRRNYNRLGHQYRRLLLLGFGLCAATTALADLPVTGFPVAEFDWVDQEMKTFMKDNEISAGVIGIMKDGVIVYQRGFGWIDQDRSTDMPENALVRVASCTKPFTAAAVRQLVSVDDHVFDFGGGGILRIAPFPGLDPHLPDIRIQNCLEHKAGWEREPDFCPTAASYSQMPCEIAAALNVQNVYENRC